jgi:hypothetical protein
MKKLKKFGKSSFAVVLSLVLCAGMVVPAFAAVEFNKDAHVDADTGALKQNEAGDYDYYLGGNVTLDKTLVIGAGVGANIDLNGYTLAGSGEGSVIKVTGQDAKLTLDDTSESGGGKVTGGTGEDQNGKTYGGGAYVDSGGNLTIKGGEISGNQATHGGGVYLYNGSTLVVDGGFISDNKATGYVSSQGGGVYSAVSSAVQPGGTVKTNSIDIKSGGISNNSADFSGGGMFATNTNINMSGGSITNNSAEKFGGGGISFTNGNMQMNGGTISGNKAGSNGGGIEVGGDGYLTATDGVITNNFAGKNGGGIYASGSSGIQNGKPVYWYARVDMQKLEASGSHIYGNTAETAGDDINTGRLGYFYLKEADGWYSDTKEDRDSEEKVGITVSENSGYVTIGQNKSAKAHAEHTWDEGATTEPTCTEEGKTVYTCTYCNETKTENIEKLEHEWGEGTVQQETSCTQEGVMVYTCTCGMSKEEPIEKLEHTPGEAVRENEVPADYGVAGSYEEVVKCTHCGEELSRVEKEIPPLEQPDEPTPPVTPPTTPDVPGIPEEPGVTEIEDEDVPLAGLPVELAAEEPLTRGQLMAILHWMDSEPAAQLATFMDVAADHDFALAIGWAQENGIAVGVSATEFAPDQVVTRGQLINFLNRYAKYVGSDLVLEVEGNANETLTWAMAEEIINDFFARLYA